MDVPKDGPTRCQKRGFSRRQSEFRWREGCEVSDRWMDNGGGEQTDGLKMEERSE